MADITKRILAHMAWSNQQVYDAVIKLPDEALDAYLINPEWTAGEILRHILGGATWYVHCLSKEPWLEIKKPNDMKDVNELKILLAKLDEQIIAQVNQPDELVNISDEYGTRQNMRSTILAQAVHHSTEHRAQLICALESRGFGGINLDDFDTWAHESMSSIHA